MANPPEAHDDALHRRGLMFILSSPSGAGKTTISRRLLEHDERIGLSVSVTTRPPRPGEVVVVKQYASAFCGTSLSATLVSLGVDTVVIGGVSTSGCVRASATDALQLGFRPMVVRQACGDRTAAVQEANLFDLDAKYADVVDEDEALAHLVPGGTPG